MKVIDRWIKEDEKKEKEEGHFSTFAQSKFPNLDDNKLIVMELINYGVNFYFFYIRMDVTIGGKNYDR